MTNEHLDAMITLYITFDTCASVPIGYIPSIGTAEWKGISFLMLTDVAKLPFNLSFAVVPLTDLCFDFTIHDDARGNLWNETLSCYSAS